MMSIMSMPEEQDPFVITSYGTFQTKTLRDFTTAEIIEELRLRKKEAKLLEGLVLPDETGRE